MSSARPLQEALATGSPAVESGHPRQETLASLGQGGTRASLALTGALLLQAVVLAEAVPQLTFRAAGYNEIGRRFIAFGETDQANDVFLKSLHSIGDVRDTSAQAVALAGLAQISSETGTDLESNDAVRAQLTTLASRAGR